MMIPRDPLRDPSDLPVKKPVRLFERVRLLSVAVQEAEDAHGTSWRW